jgi:hypothetical protein
MSSGTRLDEFWKGVVYERPEAEHVCEDFGVALACTGESCLMICRKCGKGWTVPCKVKGKAKGQKRLSGMRKAERSGAW